MVTNSRREKGFICVCKLLLYLFTTSQKVMHIKHTKEKCTGQIASCIKLSWIRKILAPEWRLGFQYCLNNNKLSSKEKTYTVFDVV